MLRWCLLLVAISPVAAFTAWRQETGSRVVQKRGEVLDEVEGARFDLSLDELSNSLDANEIYDTIMENAEIRGGRGRHFDSPQMIPVFRSNHNPTEVGFLPPLGPATTTPPATAEARFFPTKLPSQPRPAFRNQQNSGRSATAVPKPVHIEHTGPLHRGPTYNCRVLNPEIDGRASANNDWSCPTTFPGIAKDGSCRCLYEVEGRDENGCATGFVYTCRRV